MTNELAIQIARNCGITVNIHPNQCSMMPDVSTTVGSFILFISEFEKEIKKEMANIKPVKVTASNSTKPKPRAKKV